MRKTYVYDPDLESLVQVRGPGSNYYDDTPKGAAIISDMEPYRAIASDVACNGKRPMIGGRRQHREFLRRNGYVEVGNEKPISGQREIMTRADRIADIRRALGDYGSNTRG